MGARLEGVFERTVRGLIKAYPPRFRARFGEEMLQVYSDLEREALEKSGTSGLLELWLRTIGDGARGALAQWIQVIIRRRRGMMKSNEMGDRDGVATLSAGQAGLAALPFVLFAAANMAAEVTTLYFPHDGYTLGEMLLLHPYLAFNWLILLGLAAGIVSGFPRWTFSYLGWALINVLLWANMSFYGQPVNWMWLPLAGVMALALAPRGGTRPGQTMLSGMRRELTLLPLGLYIAFASIYMIYDENNHPALLFFMAGAGLAAGLGAWGYFRASTPLRRALALTGGLALTALLSVWNSLTWDAEAYYGLEPGMVLRGVVAGMTGVAVLGGLMMGIGWLAERRARRKSA